MVDFKDADGIMLVLDNLNTHAQGAFYKRFEPKYARMTLNRLELAYTPIHGSWLNIAENELSVLTKQCSNRNDGGNASPSIGMDELS
jgi:hypothetical protein